MKRDGTILRMHDHGRADQTFATRIDQRIVDRYWLRDGDQRGEVGVDREAVGRAAGDIQLVHVSGVQGRIRNPELRRLQACVLIFGQKKWISAISAWDDKYI